MTSNVEELGAHERLTVKEALALSLRECEEYEDVIILAYRKETGDLIIRSSKMTKAEANYMYDKAKQDTFTMEDEA